eukprot:TRINITY_DN1531_c2_g2_i3.p1 TRINITY_DN1531_c2_g2~~TRINITY_DN1531_c2_g2_i3.p1  ORF type:complete len:303 (+),score=111.36 TRINITY_DN1531_c2_g2_i3:85-993(+)
MRCVSEVLRQQSWNWWMERAQGTQVRDVGFSENSREFWMRSDSVRKQYMQPGTVLFVRRDGADLFGAQCRVRVERATRVAMAVWDAVCGAVVDGQVRRASSVAELSFRPTLTGHVIEVQLRHTAKPGFGTLREDLERVVDRAGPGSCIEWHLRADDRRQQHGGREKRAPKRQDKKPAADPQIAPAFVHSGLLYPAGLTRKQRRALVFRGRQGHVDPKELECPDGVRVAGVSDGAVTAARYAELLSGAGRSLAARLASSESAETDSLSGSLEASSSKSNACDVTGPYGPLSCIGAGCWADDSD